MINRLRPFLANRRERSRGAALVEFALVLPLLIALFVGVVDFGEAWFNSTSVQTGVRSASVVGFDAGNQDFQHDQLVVESIIRELDGRGFDEIERIVIYDADNPSLNPGCLADVSTTATAASGHMGDCNIYGKTFLSNVAAGTNSITWANECASNVGRWWCYNTRGTTDGAVIAPDGSNLIAAPTFNVGVEVTVKADALVGFFPFFQEYTLTKTSIIPEIANRSTTP